MSRVIVRGLAADHTLSQLATQRAVSSAIRAQTALAEDLPIGSVAVSLTIYAAVPATRRLSADASGPSALVTIEIVQSTLQASLINDATAVTVRLQSRDGCELECAGTWWTNVHTPVGLWIGLLVCGAHSHKSHFLTILTVAVVLSVHPG